MYWSFPKGNKDHSNMLAIAEIAKEWSRLLYGYFNSNNAWNYQQKGGLRDMTALVL